MKLAEKLMRFMYGRNGMDALNHALFWLYIILWAVNLFAQNTVISLLCTAAAVWMLFRCFSKNLPARRAENMKYWNFKTQVQSKTQNIAIVRSLGAWWKKVCIRTKNIGTKRYRTCPGCHAELCLPRKTGKHTVRCPRCGNSFSVNIVF